MEAEVTNVIEVSSITAGLVAVGFLGRSRKVLYTSRTN